MKNTKRPCIAKRTMSVQMYVIFFSTHWPAIQIALPKGRGLTGKLYREKVLEKLEQCTVNTGQRLELRILNFTTTLLHTKQLL